MVSVRGLLRVTDIPAELPYRDEIVLAVGESGRGHGAATKFPGFVADGGSCLAAPDGEWVLAPVRGKRGLFTVDLDIGRVLEER